MADTRDPRVPTVPLVPRVPPARYGRLARLVVIALGLVGFVAAPAGAPATPAPAAGSSVTSIASAVAAHAPARGRTAERHRDGRAKAAAAVAARHTTAAPSHGWHAALPAPELQVGPPPAWLDRPARAPSRLAAAFGDAPRGRSPPTSTGI
ncbi:hypothetical protein [Actinomadura terrae]|uniref:hypothetical protein n=1 Tax=Actinomadura terrae TaxID=604353 RepID=UPI001FA796D7|nr:hypothetical protein [Actinomadura terrae]